MKRILALLLVLSITMVFTACSESLTSNQAHTTGNISTGESNEQETTETKPKHQYIGDYEQEPVYQELMRIQTCRDPEVLCQLLEELYGEEFTYVKMEQKNPDNYDGYKPPYESFICSASALYDVSGPMAKGLIKSDTYAFFKAISEAPAFIMDGDGSYLVYSYKSTQLESGITVYSVNSWVIEDLFMCLHGFIDGDTEKKNFMRDAVRYMDYYMEFENLIVDSLDSKQEQTTPSTSTTPSTPSNSGQQSSGEQTTTPNNPTTEQTTPPLTAADYYQMGKDSHSAKQYLEAVEHFKKADGYSDSSTMILDCYYEYGKAQMDLQYTSEGIKYLSMCRGYKDTDETLLSFYYTQAAAAYNALIQDFSTYGDHSAAYQDAKQKLLLCEGYRDSTTMMRVVESIYAACKDMNSVSGWEASLSGMSVTANGNNVSITKEKFMGGGGGDLVLSTDVLQKTFTATISRIFAPNMRNYGEAVVIEALLLLFTDISSTSDLSASLQSETAWTINGTTETFSTSYGGYNISIQVTEADWGYIDCTITVSR